MGHFVSLKKLPPSIAYSVSNNLLILHFKFVFPELIWFPNILECIIIFSSTLAHIDTCYSCVLYILVVVPVLVHGIHHNIILVWMPILTGNQLWRAVTDTCGSILRVDWITFTIATEVSKNQHRVHIVTRFYFRYVLLLWMMMLVDQVKEWARQKGRHLTMATLRDQYRWW